VTQRDPRTTRRLLLQAGQQEVYLHGFQAAAIDDILRLVGVTKGAFFYYFESKTDFGYALVDEILSDMIASQWVVPLRESTDVLDTIAIEFERGVDALRERLPILGCPLNNLAQEMNPLDDGFRRRTSAVFDMWRDSFRTALERACADGVVVATTDPTDTAHALVAQIEGTLSLARNSQDPETLSMGARALRRFLESMRAN
jgi:TetR/AcrR family transcriptional repressor of nem operon